MVTEETTLQLSVVIPVRDEADNLRPLHQELCAALSGFFFEVIFVDDGSSDGSFERLRELHETDRRVIAVELRRPFGKTAALAAGFTLCRAPRVATLDGDLQDDPAELPSLLARLDEGYDLVCGWRRHRQDPVAKRWPSALFNWTIRRATGLLLHDINCGLKVYRREVVQVLPLYGQRHRFIPLLAQHLGYRVGELEVRHRPRRSGRSKYGAGRLLSGLLDFLQVLLVLEFGSRPFRFFGAVGLGLSVVGVLVALWCAWMGGRAPLGVAVWLGLAALLLLAGWQSVLVGLLGEMRLAAHPPGEGTKTVKEVIGRE